MSFQKRSLYLAGPITGLSYGEARHGWRKEFARLIGQTAPHIECFSPMRQKEFLSEAQCMECKEADLDKYGEAIAKPHGILTRDRNDVRERDALVACFLGAERVSIGTVWEIGYASCLLKPIVVVMEPGNIHDHTFVTASAGYVVETLEEAALIAGSILTPGV